VVGLSDPVDVQGNASGMPQNMGIDNQRVVVLEQERSVRK
jgi:hypothetical protein